MLHAIMAIRQLRASQHQAWQAMFSFYAFLSDGAPKAHLPIHAHGILGAEGQSDRQAIRQMLINNLSAKR